ncbi:unnamed protein product [Ambrosiozyma monospora]|uniref:Unnamed protein product n=1 Tax=Ambrosiozyma monospora TaxID=43982 RepID=A0ACB5TJG1_AMBMO|nr:unnamed protein product [Ambrosiozyma monospora]
MGIPSEDVENSIHVGITTSDSSNQRINHEETNDTGLDTYENEVAIVSSEVVLTSALHNKFAGSNSDVLLSDYQLSRYDPLSSVSELCFESDEDEPDISTFGSVMSTNTYRAYKEWILNSFKVCF